MAGHTGLLQHPPGAPPHRGRPASSGTTRSLGSTCSRISFCGLRNDYYSGPMKGSALQTSGRPPASPGQPSSSGLPHQNRFDLSTPHGGPPCLCLELEPGSRTCQKHISRATSTTDTPQSMALVQYRCGAAQPLSIVRVRSPIRVLPTPAGGARSLRGFLMGAIARLWHHHTRLPLRRAPLSG